MGLGSGLILDHQKDGHTTDPIQWSGRFSVGINELDMQHQRLISLINRLILVSETHCVHSEVNKSALDEMTAYAQVHFKAEERLMEAYDFPLMKEHKRSHLDFQVKTMELYEGKGQSAEQIADDIRNYLGNWLTHHILQEDMAYKDFFKEKGLS